MANLLGDVTAVLMAKNPEDGLVKTRLRTWGGFSAAGAAELAWAMLRCTAQRLHECGRLVLAVSPDGCGPGLAEALGVPGVGVVDQGAGDLGERLDRVWRRLGTERPIAFFGGDSPDIPEEALAAILPALAESDVAVGPTDDGGYWTLAARGHHPAVLRNIDWGGDQVYDQTCQRAVAAGLVVGSLPVWHDVDRPEDVDGLRRRLRDPRGSFHSTLIDAAPLRRLAEQLGVL
ncbi:MAG: TIGR04282 family arsenosugar biosynthesis glycosyltransferase [Planctomycetota bacterium]|jgi:rSAM/selenodomain-associated transferase 1